MENSVKKEIGAGAGSSFIGPDTDTGDIVGQDNENDVDNENILENGRIDPRFRISIGGKEFVVYEGLLDLAHQEGLSEIATELIQTPSEVNGNTAICKARVVTSKGTFEGIGDASPENVNGTIKPHIIRMAETRAKARALRDAVNVGICSVEELGPEGNDEAQRNITEKQMNYIEMLLANDDQKEIFMEFMAEVGKEKLEELTSVEASRMIGNLKGEKI